MVETAGGVGYQGIFSQASLVSSSQAGLFGFLGSPQRARVSHDNHILTGTGNSHFESNVSPTTSNQTGVLTSPAIRFRKTAPWWLFFRITLKPPEGLCKMHREFHCRTEEPVISRVNERCETSKKTRLWAAVISYRGSRTRAETSPIMFRLRSQKRAARHRLSGESQSNRRGVVSRRLGMG